MGEVIELNTITYLDIPAERVLNSALKKDLESAVVLGYDKEGNFYFASSIANGPDVLWLMEKLKLELLTVEIP